MSSSVPSYPCWPRKACWPALWSKTSPCAGGRESASAACTSRGSRTAGNAPDPTKPSASSQGAKTEKQQLGFVALGTGTWIYVTLCPRKRDHSDEPSAQVEPGDKGKSGFSLRLSCERQEPVWRSSCSRRGSGVLSCLTMPWQHPNAMASVSAPWLRTVTGGKEPTQLGMGLALWERWQCPCEAVLATAGCGLCPPEYGPSALCFPGMFMSLFSILLPSPNSFLVLTQALAILRKVVPGQSCFCTHLPLQCPVLAELLGMASPSQCSLAPQWPWLLCCWMRVGRLVSAQPLWRPCAQPSVVVLGWPVPLAALLRTSSVALAVPVGHTALHQAQSPEKPREL